MEALLRDGVVLLTKWFDPSPLEHLHELAQMLLTGAALPPEYRFTPYAQSVVLSALDRETVLAPLTTADLTLLGDAPCLLDHSWLRRRYAPCHAPPLYQPNSWHQDGALLRQFSPDPAVEPPSPQNFITLWLPLHDCAADTPTLEFIRQPLSALRHFTLLSDSQLRAQFTPADFWIPPPLRRGDGLLFRSGTLHRTHVTEAMSRDRFSVEYRFGVVQESSPG